MVCEELDNTLSVKLYVTVSQANESVMLAACSAGEISANLDSRLKGG